MKNTIRVALATSASLLAFTTFAAAEDNSRFSFEGELEIGVNKVFKSDDPDAKIRDAFATAEVTVSFEITETVSIFAGFTLESVTDAETNRSFDDMGLYIDSLGVALDFGSTNVSLGKIAAPFGVAWDAAPGYFGADFAEDYEISEVLGASVETELWAGVFRAAVFFNDNTVLSKSLGTNRGRNRTADGGIGNTGKLNNIALQYEVETGDAVWTLSAMRRSAGAGDVRDETGAAIGLVYGVSEDFEVVAELAGFNGYNGTDAKSNYATIGAAYSIGAFTPSVSYTRRAVDGAPTDQLMSVGLDYTFANDITLSSGLAMVKEEGVKSNQFGLSVIIPF